MQKYFNVISVFFQFILKHFQAITARNLRKQNFRHKWVNVLKLLIIIEKKNNDKMSRDISLTGRLS